MGVCLRNLSLPVGLSPSLALTPHPLRRHPGQVKREPGPGSHCDYFFVRKTNGLRAPIPDLRCASSGMTMERES